MVRALAILVAVASTAAAEPADTAATRLGYHVTIGALPLDGRPTVAFALGLGAEQRLFGHTSALLEYEWLWLESRVPPTMAPPEYGTGHRVQLGLRHPILDKRLQALRLFVDGELGGGAMLVTDNLRGTHTLPHAFAGLRLGYDLRGRNADSPAHTFTAEIVIRAIAIDRGAGVTAGFGMAWGN